MRLMLLEDSEITKRLFQRAAEEVGYEIDFATTLKEAKESFDSYDVIFADLTLPDSTAQETVDWLSTINKRVIVVTICDDPNIARRLGKMRIPCLHKSCMDSNVVRFALFWTEGLCEFEEQIQLATSQLIKALSRA